MLFVVGLLDLTTTVCFVHGPLHRVRDPVRIHDDMSMRVTRGTPDDLDQRRIRAQETFLIRIEDCDQRNLRHIQTLTQQIDADQNVEFPRPQVMNDLGPLDRRDIRMQIAHLDTRFLQVIGKVFRHLFGQSRDEHSFILLDPQLDLGQQVIDLPLKRPNLNLRIQQPGRPDDLLRHLLCL